MTHSEKLSWLQLARTPRIGPVTFFQLLARYGNASDALKALPTLKAGDVSQRVAGRAGIEKEWQQTTALGAQILCAAESDYPPLLKQHPPPPPILTALGRTELLQHRCVAIVGARQASAAGRKLARDISADLSDAGYVIVSGLARGIDGEAHAASLSGGTIAVLAGGIDHIYPPQHERLYREIQEQGLLISESPLGHRATARDFPRRNRIITGICEGVVIIEAAERSGSLISARTALEQNREVMAVPGSPLDPRAAGGNRLLREGAILVRNAQDVMEALSGPRLHAMKAPERPDYAGQPNEHADIPATQIDAVRSALTPEPLPISEIAQTAGLGIPRCAAILVELELAGLAVTYSGGRASLAF
ncbi:MAG: DNA-processing protein DprA [Pseudomonadota bacterium]